MLRSRKATPCSDADSTSFVAANPRPMRTASESRASRIDNAVRMSCSWLTMSATACRPSMPAGSKNRSSSGAFVFHSVSTSAVEFSRRASTCAAVHSSLPSPSRLPDRASATPPARCETTSCTDHSGQVGTIVDARSRSMPPTSAVMRARLPAYAIATSPMTVTILARSPGTDRGPDRHLRRRRPNGPWSFSTRPNGTPMRRRSGGPCGGAARACPRPPR